MNEENNFDYCDNMPWREQAKAETVHIFISAIRNLVNYGVEKVKEVCDAASPEGKIVICSALIITTGSMAYKAIH